MWQRNTSHWIFRCFEVGRRYGWWQTSSTWRGDDFAQLDGTFVLVIAVLAVCIVQPAVAAVHAIPSDSVNCSPTTNGRSGDGIGRHDGCAVPEHGPDSQLGKVISANAGCKDCQWAVSPACSDTGPIDGMLLPGAMVGCADPQDLRYRVYLRHGNGPWMLQGTVCLGPGERPTSVTDIGEAVRARVVNYLPDAHPSFQPRAGGIVNLPTLFAAGESPTLRTAPFDVLGFTVVVTATARWEWTFDRGVTRDRSPNPAAAIPTSPSRTPMQAPVIDRSA